MKISKFKKFLLESEFPIKIFLASRIGVFLISYLGLVLVPYHPTGMQFQDYPNNLLIDGLVRWDWGWYKSIAEGGYSNLPNYQGQTNLAFFPLFPLLIKIINLLIGGDLGIIGITISNVAFLISLIVLYKIIKIHFDGKIARKGIILLAFFPFSFYFSTPYAESLFLLFAVMSFYFGEKDSWFLAGICAALASATRSLGILLTPALLLLYMEKRQFDFKKFDINLFLPLLGSLGLLSFIGFNYLRFNDPLIFIKSSYVEGWNKDVNLSQAVSVVRSTFSGNNLLGGHINILDLTHVVIFVFSLILIFKYFRRMPFAYSFWTVLVSFASFGLHWPGYSRYVIVIFPIFIYLALLLRNTKGYYLTFYFFTLLTTIFVFMYSHFMWLT